MRVVDVRKINAQWGGLLFQIFHLRKYLADFDEICYWEDEFLVRIGQMWGGGGDRVRYKGHFFMKNRSSIVNSHKKVK
jgi:hypothetical protein